MHPPDKYNAKRNLSAIVDFSNNINSNLNLDFALSNLLLTCFGKLTITKGVIALFDQNDILKIYLGKGIKEEELKLFYEKHRNDISENVFNDFIDNSKIKLVEKIISSDSVLGYLFLREKLDKSIFSDEDKEFISTVLKIGSTTIRNSQSFESLTELNKMLDSKINQLNSIFDLGKEFSGILEMKRVSKLLVYSISAQMLISKYAIVIYKENSTEILESKYENSKLNAIMDSKEIDNITSPVIISGETSFCNECVNLGIALIVPMMIKSEKKGLLFLGNRITKQEYSKSDIEYISSIASFAIISIENARLFNETIEKQKLEKDLETARNIQQNLLPKRFPRSDIFEISAVNKTAKQVGGDYYDVVKLDDKNTLIAIADVSGKGVQAALLMANVQAFLKSICKQNIALDKASNIMNDLVSENTIMGSFITFFWG
ncbi:MAG: SpoIIE family protein phosphatase, partial [Melioribacteraceae bacterium]|nr:SpoIIE family protein phosphatase [Melioribacteraceae bacterium]